MKTFDSTPDRVDRDRIQVGVSQRVVVKDGETLVAYGLGSTVAVALYDPASGLAGMANAVLPRRRAGDDGDDAKFVDSAVQTTLRDLAERGARLASLRAKLAGGAAIMELEDLATGVGAENVRVARSELADLGVPIAGEDVGGDRGRVVEFDAATGEMFVTTVDDDQPRRI